jgi:hypothetical protein
VAFLASLQISAQTAAAPPSPTPNTLANVPWKMSLTVDGYLPAKQDGYVDPVLTADHGWLHLEARYNYEDLNTGSVWLGYNVTAGKDLKLSITPMIGGVLGQTVGIAPGCEASLSYKQFDLSVTNEYVFDTKNHSGSFYYATPQLTYSPKDWFRVGLTAIRTKILHMKEDVQRGFLVGFSHKHAEFTTYVYDLGWTDPTLVFEVGWNF